MVKEAICKINQEIEDNKENAYINYVGEYLVDYINKNPQHAKNIMKEDKTIMGSLNHMKNAAKENAQDGMAILTPEEGFKTVLDYYEIKKVPELKVVNTHKKVNISLDDLL